jgi:hypothetical protein
MITPEQQNIEDVAGGVLHNLGFYLLPIDPREIARQEEILLAPGHYGGCFDGRIEYRRLLKSFIIFYAHEGPGRNEGRVNFSLGHELGHFYLKEHRNYLLSGLWHGSQAGFVSDNRLEREADWFSASLLMPADLFRREVHGFRQRVCTLRDLMTLADRLKVSLTSAAIRYCECDIEASSVILSRGGVVTYHVPSWEMKRYGFGYLPRWMLIPPTSHTARLAIGAAGPSGVVEGEVDAEVWFDGRWGKLYEEAVILGGTGLTLTYLVREQSTR